MRESMSDKDSGNIGNVMDDISSGADGKNFGSDCVVVCVA